MSGPSDFSAAIAMGFLLGVAMCIGIFLVVALA